MYQKESPQQCMDNQSADQLIFNNMTTREEQQTSTSNTFTLTTLTNHSSQYSSHSGGPASTSSTGLRSASSADQFLPRISKFESSDVDDDDDDDDYDDDDDDESQDSNSNTVVRSKQRKAPQPEYICLTSAMGLPSSQGDQRPARKLPGPRPSRTLEEMTPIEAERRRRRRERNKNAAAKCRQRRLDLTNELLAETEQLEHESTRLEREIASLRRQKNQLEFVLDAHKASCTVIPSSSYPLLQGPVKREPSHSGYTLTSSASANAVERPSSLSIVPATAAHASNSSNLKTTATSTGSIFSFDPATAQTGFTPMLNSAGELNSPSSYVMLSPSTLLAQ